MKGFFMCLLLMVTGACVEDSAEEPIRMTEAELGKGDAQARMIGRGLKLGVKSAVDVLSEGGWVIEGRSNKELTEVRASVGGRDQNVEILEQGFRVKLDQLAYQDLLVETHLKVDVLSGAESAALEVRYAARWVEKRGSKRLRYEQTLQPVVLQGGVTALRGHLQTDEGFTVESVFTDDDLEPSLSRDFDWKWQVEWTIDQAGFLSDFQEDSVYFTTVDSDDMRYQSSAKVRLRAVEQIWTRVPAEHVIANCDTSTRFCMHHLPPDAPDAAECGSVQEVLACFRFDAR